VRGGEHPQVVTTIWTGDVKVYPTETLDELKEKFAGKIKMAELTAPNRVKLLVNVENVVDVDPPTDAEAPATNAVLFFGTGPKSPRQAVRESMEELIEAWKAVDMPLDALE
jgi:hypothetical protein